MTKTGHNIIIIKEGRFNRSGKERNEERKKSLDESLIEGAYKNKRSIKKTKNKVISEVYNTRRYTPVS